MQREHKERMSADAADNDENNVIKERVLKLTVRIGVKEMEHLNRNEILIFENITIVGIHSKIYTIM